MENYPMGWTQQAAKMYCASKNENKMSLFIQIRENFFFQNKKLSTLFVVFFSLSIEADWLGSVKIKFLL